MDFSKMQTRIEEVLTGAHDGFFAEVLAHVHCMSTPRVYAIINAIVSSMDPDDLYVEVGTYQGGSLISALLGNQAKAIGVDAYSEFKETNSYMTTKGNLEHFDVADRVDLRNMDFKTFFEHHFPATSPIAVYYYDGQHDYEGQLAGMEAAWPFLRPGSIVLVDDYTYPEVNRAVNQFVANHIDQVGFQFVMRPNQNTDPTWWNGVVVLKVF